MHSSVANTVSGAKISVWSERGSLPCNEVEDSVLSHAVLPHHTHDCCFVHIPCGFSITPGEDTQTSFPVRAKKEILLLLVVISQIYHLASLMLSECLCLAVPHHCSDSSLLLHRALIYSGTEGYKRAGTCVSSCYRTPVCPCLPNTILFKTVVVATKTDWITAGAWETQELLGDRSLCNCKALAVFGGSLYLERLVGTKWATRKGA